MQESLLKDLDSVTLSTATRAEQFAPYRLQRREDVARKRRERKLRWLRRMYHEGLRDHDADETAPASDEEVDGLVEWSSALDFDSYHNEWLILATSSQGGGGYGIDDATR